MSSNAFQALKARQDRVSSGGASAQTLVVQITGYETKQSPHCAVGHPLLDTGEPDTGRTVRVFLREDKDAAKREYSRTEIADYANSRHKAATEIGGVIMFAGAIETETPGVYSARWPDAISHYPGEAACRAAYATTYFNTEGDRPYFALEYYKPEMAVAVDSVQAIEQKLPEALEPVTPNAAVCALIRLVSHEGDSVAVRAKAAWNKDPQSGFTQAASGLESATKFYQMEDWGLIQQVFASGEVASAEIIPGMRINAIGATLKSLMKKPQRLEAMGKVYRDEAGHVAFTKTWFAARFHESGDPYLTALQRASNDSPRYRAANIPTASFAPSAEQTLQADAGNAPAPESQHEIAPVSVPAADPAPTRSAAVPAAADAGTASRSRPSPRAPNLQPPAAQQETAAAAVDSGATTAAPPPDMDAAFHAPMPPSMDDSLVLDDDDMKALENFSMSL